MRKLITNLLIITIISTSLSSQPKIWIEQGSGLGGSESIHFQNNKIVESGTFFPTADLTSEVKDNPMALQYAKDCNDYRFSAKMWFWLGYIPGLTSMILSIPFGINDTVSSEVAGGMFLGGLLAGLITPFIMGSKMQTSRHYMYKSINTFNGVYDKKLSSLLDLKKNKSMNVNVALGSSQF